MDRYFTDPDLLGRVPGLLLILGGIYLGMGMVACLLINQPPEDWIQRYTIIQPTTRGLDTQVRNLTTNHQRTGYRYTIIQPTTRGLDTQVHNYSTNHQRTGYTGTQPYYQPPEDWIHRYTTIQPTTRGLDTLQYTSTQVICYTLEINNNFYCCVRVSEGEGEKTLQDYLIPWG